MSDKAMFHRLGVMVIEKFKDERGELEVIPIAPIVNYHRTSPMASLVEKKPQEFWAGSLVSPFPCVGMPFNPCLRDIP
jgi:hypothetical protein